MITLRSASYAVGALAFAIICAICATVGPRSALGAPVPVLFVSDKGTNDVTRFSLPDLAVKGTSTGFSEPRGLCSDPKGDIWVANYGTRQMLELNSAGTIIQTINDPDGYPFACTVDVPTLAYANLHNLVSPDQSAPPPDPSAAPDPSGAPDPTMTPCSGPGEVETTNGVTSMSHDSTDLCTVNGVGTDPGDIYIVGTAVGGAFTLAVLPAGSTQIHQITVTGGTINSPGMVQWEGNDHYLAVGDRKCGTPRSTCVYHIKISGTTGTIMSKTTFEAPNGHVICDMGQGVIGGSGGAQYLAGGDDENECGYTTSSVDVWAFPAGGMPTNSNTTALNKPFGTAISAP